MARSKRTSSSTEPLSHRHWFELTLLLLGASSVLLLMSLISYNPLDQGFFHEGTIEVKNMAGSFGAELADILLTLFGFWSYTMPFLMLLIGWQMTRPSQRLGFLQQLTFVIGIFLYSGIDNFLNQFYDDKGLSADVREDNLINGIKSIPTLIIKNPFGLTLNSKTSDNEKNVFYVGTNFLPITYLQQGGVFSFIGIILLLYFSIYDSYRMLFNDKLSKLYRVLSITLICYFPFIFQRMTVWDSVIFAFLFLPILFKLNEKSFK